MGWTEHQHALLKAMGLQVWSPVVTPDPGPVPAPSPEHAMRAMPAMPAEPAPATGVTHAEKRAAPPAATPAATPAAPPAATSVADPASPSPVADLGWPALRQAVAACRACSLCESRRQTVFGVGGERAPWMVVGEAPGEEEDRLGEPFVGRSGQLLDGMLAALGLSRTIDGAKPDRQVYMANTLKCRPPGNRNPTSDELARCEPFLMRQIALVQPRIILAMGRFAVQALLRTDAPIGRLRGQVHSYQGVPLVVTYHPAYLLRNLPDKAKAWADLCLAADVLAQADAAAGQG